MAFDWEPRIRSYLNVTGYPQSIFVGSDGRLVGTWIMGNAFFVKSGYYGGYPAGYLRRIAALFPESRADTTLHLFAGKVDLDKLPGDTLDINGQHNPTYVDDAQELSRVPLQRYELVLADPPYSIEDAERYSTTMVKRNKVLRALERLKPGAVVVWLDQVLPMYKKAEFDIIGVVGMVKSTNHRFRVVTFFQRRAPCDTD
jgi:hypothetical protein